MKIVVATILIIGTLFGISALVSSVYKGDGAAPNASGVRHQQEELKRSAAEVSIVTKDIVAGDLRLIKRLLPRETASA